MKSSFDITRNVPPLPSILFPGRTGIETNNRTEIDLKHLPECRKLISCCSVAFLRFGLLQFEASNIGHFYILPVANPVCYTVC